MSRGIARERQVRKLLEADGWWVCRAAGSLGDADLVALVANDELWPIRTEARLLIEVKSTTRGPYHGTFGPKDLSRTSACGTKNRSRGMALLVALTQESQVDSFKSVA